MNRKQGLVFKINLKRLIIMWNEIFFENEGVWLGLEEIDEGMSIQCILLGVY